MYRFRRILVPLALNELDEAALRYASMICGAARSERVYFLHVAGSLDIPAQIREEFPELAQTPEDTAESEMKGRVARYFGDHPELEVRYEVSEGAPLIPVLDALRRHEVDLVIMGRKPEQEWTGTLSERVARKAPCSALIVPGGAPASISRILVPVDFSDRCGEAVDAAIAIANAIGDVPISCLHVYHVPAGYTKIGKTFEQFSEIMKRNAEMVCDTFLAEVDAKGAGIDRRFVLDEHPARAIKRSIDIERADLLVIAARGRTDSAALLLGSVTERCLRIAHVPVLAVKRKGDNMNLLKALLYI